MFFWIKMFVRLFVVRFYAISDNDKYLLNNKMGSIARKVQLGDLIENAEEGGLAEDAVSLEHLDSGIAPSHIVVAAGEFTTAGGDTDETITVSGLLATDIVIVTLHTAGASPVTIVDASASAGQIDVDMSADPSTDHVLSYVAYRAAS